MGEGLQKAARAAKRTKYADTPEPAPRQVWGDCDKRCPGREVRIDRVADGFAHCTVILHAGGPAGRPTRIHLDRFFPTATGYRYLRTEEAK